MKKNVFQKCPICNQDIVSDANAPNYCKLCGMIVDEDQEFCCKFCEDKFKKIIGD